MHIVCHPVKSHFLLLLVAFAIHSLGSAPRALAQSNTLASSTLVEGAGAGNDSVLLTVTPPTSAWTAAANDSWLHVATASASGAGNATILFSFDANTGATRTGSCTIAGQTLTIVQAGSTYVATNSLTAIVPAILLNPQGAAVDGNGNVYIADTGNNAIKEYTAATQTLSTLVSSGLASPRGVAVDGNGNVYIADTGNNAIKEYSAATQIVTTLVSAGLSSPQGVAVDGNGNVYFSTGDTIKEWAAASQTVSTLVSAGLSSPAGVAVDGNSNVFIADSSANAIYEYTATTQSLTTLAAAGLSAPHGVAVDGNENVYIADTNNNAIKEYTAATQAVSTLVASGLKSPGGVAVDSAGNVYLADTDDSAIKKYTATNESITSLVSGLNQPQGVAVDASGNVYLADTENNAIKEYTAASQTLSTLVSTGLSSPQGVAVDSLGNVYIADTNNDAIKEYTANTQIVSTLVASGLKSPGGVAVDGSGNVYIADTNNNAIKEYTAATQAVTTLVSSRLSFPAGVAVDGSGNVYIADTDNLAIKEYTTTTQVVTTLVSSGLSGPYGVAVDGSGNVYIADASNETVKKYTAATQTLTTLAASLASPRGVAVNGAGNVYIADSLGFAIEELPHAFIDLTIRSEPNTAGADALPDVLPASVNLQGLFAPSSDQSWLTIGGPITGGVIGFSFTADSSPGRIAHITALGQSITIVQGTPLPIASNYTALADSAAPITIDVLANDKSPVNYPLTVTSVTTPSLGRVKINASTTITYTPKASFASITATDSFTYTIGDGHGGSATGTVTIHNPFQPIKGTYDGLVASSGIPNGYFSLSLTGGGSFTGALKLAGLSYSFGGAFSLNGIAAVSIKSTGGALIGLTLELDETGTNLAATVAANGNIYTANTGTREEYTAKNPAPSIGHYTVLLPAPAAPSGTTATAEVTVTDGKIAGLGVTGGGSGYVAPPRVVITGAPGAGAVAAAVLSGGSVASITIKTAGAKYPATGTTVTIDPPSAGLPQGTGWATMSVSASGAVIAAGKLGDGTAFSFGGFVNHGTVHDAFAFYTPLYSGISKPNNPGSIVGTITFEPLTESDCDGSLTWLKPAQTAGALYQSGFDTSIDFMGSQYLAPHSAQALTFTDTTAGAAAFALSLGNLATPIDHTLSISKLNVVKVTDPGADKLSLRITAATGAFSGSFDLPPKNAAAAISGVVDQKTNTAAGLFLGPSQTGSATLMPQ